MLVKAIFSGKVWYQYSAQSLVGLKYLQKVHCYLLETKKLDLFTLYLDNLHGMVCDFREHWL